MSQLSNVDEIETRRDNRAGRINFYANIRTSYDGEEFFNFWTPLRFAEKRGLSRREKPGCNQLVVADERDLASLRLDVNHPDKAA